MLIEQIIHFNGAPWQTYAPITGYFYEKTKISKGNSSIGLLFTAKI